MHLLCSVLALSICAAGTTAQASTTVIHESVKGIVAGANTRDTLGLFSAPGTDLAGETMTLQLQYSPAAFNVTGTCHAFSQCSYRESTGADVAGSLTIAVSINGARQVYTAQHFSETMFASPSNMLSLYSDTGTFGLGYRGCSVIVPFSGPVEFGESLTANPPAYGANGAEISFYTAAETLAGETLSFEITGAAR